jgi:hypothetical protein
LAAVVGPQALTSPPALAAPRKSAFLRQNHAVPRPRQQRARTQDGLSVFLLSLFAGCECLFSAATARSVLSSPDRAFAFVCCRDELFDEVFGPDHASAAIALGGRSAAAAAPRSRPGSGTHPPRSFPPFGSARLPVRLPWAGDLRAGSSAARLPREPEPVVRSSTNEESAEAKYAAPKWI